MSTGVLVRFRDAFRHYTPVWLSDRPGKNVGYRFLWSMIAPLDAATDVLLQGLRAAWPGKGTPTALPWIGRTRGILRGYGTSETDAHYVARLGAWLDTHPNAGSQLALAQQIHEYLSNHPRVRIINRKGIWVTVNEDGSVAIDHADWDWDSATLPPSLFFDVDPYWSDMWIVVYPDPWAHAPNWGDPDAPGVGDGLGHLASREEYDAVKGLIQDWKAAHSRVKCVIFTSDAALFDPANPGTCPNGRWERWSLPDPSDTRGANGSRIKSDRNTTTCRYWEPNG